MPDIVKRTSQYIDNSSFDEAYGVSTVIPVEEDGTTLVRKQNDPLDGYNLANLDVASDPLYLGFIKSDGAWYINKISISGGTSEYVKGDSGYNWGNRASESYGAFDSVF